LGAVVGVDKKERKPVEDRERFIYSGRAPKAKYTLEPGG
jgi:hypothetical protein